MQRDRITLEDIREALRRILSFTIGLTQESFLNDEKTQAAVVRQLEIIGEAAKRLSPEFRDAHPSFPWREMAGMRDKLIHGYDEVDLELVWQTVVKDVSKLATEFEML